MANVENNGRKSLPHYHGYAQNDARASEFLAHPASKIVHLLRPGETAHKRRAEAEAARGIFCHCDEPKGPHGERPSHCPYWDPELVDAPLTRLGRKEITGKAIGHGVEVILSAPTMRSLETAVLACEPQTGASEATPPPIIVLEELRARMSAHMHSQRQAVSFLRSRFPRADFSHVESDADKLWSPETESRQALEARAATFLQTLFARPERSVLVVMHYTFFLALFQPASETRVIGRNPARDENAPALIDCSDAANADSLRRPLETAELRSLILFAR